MKVYVTDYILNSGNSSIEVELYSIANTVNSIKRDNNCELELQQIAILFVCISYLQLKNPIWQNY